MAETPVVLLRNSERATYRRCRQRWLWSYAQRLEPQRTKAALAFGSLVHMALAAWYIPGRKRGEHPAKAFEHFFNEQPIEQDIWDEDDNKIDPLELGKTMLEGYVDKWGKEEHIEIISPEMSIQIDVYDKLGNYLCTWVGTVDAAFINRRTGKKGAFEHKTAKTVKDVAINSGYGEQGLSYWWALNLRLRHDGILKPTEVLGSLWYNFLRKGMPDTRPKNKQGYALNKPSKDALWEACGDNGIITGRHTIDAMTVALMNKGIDPAQFGEISARQPKPLFVRQELPLTEGELESINKRIRAEAWEMSQVRIGKAPIYKNPMMNCDWDCPFKDPCELHEMGADYEGMLELQYKEWDPYSSHELLDEKDYVI